MNPPDDVPSPIDLRTPEDAAAWARNAMKVRPWRVEFFERFAAEMSKAQGPLRVLELGSGPGFLAAHLLDARADLSMALLDFSLAMHDLAGPGLRPIRTGSNFCIEASGIRTGPTRWTASTSS